jgi:hypothetical protein
MHAKENGETTGGDVLVKLTESVAENMALHATQPSPARPYLNVTRMSASFAKKIA